MLTSVTIACASQCERKACSPHRLAGADRAPGKRPRSRAGLSNFLCKLIFGLLADVGGEPVGVVQGQGAEGLFPALEGAGVERMDALDSGDQARPPPASPDARRPGHSTYWQSSAART